MSETQTQPQQQQTDAAQRLEEKFAAQRREYSNEIMTAAQMMKDMRKLIEAKVILLSLRQRLLEDNHLIIANHDKQARLYREAKSEELLNASSNMQVRFNEREKDKFIDGQPRISKVKATMDFLQNQSNYLSDSIKTVDHALYGMKDVIDMQKLLQGV